MIPNNVLNNLVKQAETLLEEGNLSDGAKKLVEQTKSHAKDRLDERPIVIVDSNKPKG